MLTITPYGAAGEVTGSSWLIDVNLSDRQAGGERVLVDCGLFQGEFGSAERNAAPFPYDPASLDAVVLTHAHLDHCGRLPKLVADGFRGRIYATPATRDLAEIVLKDTAALAASEQREHQLRRHRPSPVPLFTGNDVDRCLERFEPLEYDQLIHLTNHVECHLVDAGHILGAASVVLHVGHERLVVSGDIGNPGSVIVRDPSPVGSAEVVVMEATYGNRRHSTSAAGGLDAFIAAVAAGVHRGGTVLVPAFSIERTQELLYAFSEWQREQRLKQVPVFLDSPMAMATTEVFRCYSRYYDREATALRNAGNDFFKFPMLHLTSTVEASRAIAHVPNPKVIVGGAGMLTGGRIRQHAREHLSDPTATLIFVGYQAKGTLGRRLQDGAKQVLIDDDRVAVRAKLVTIDSLSAHADQTALLSWLGSIEGVRQVVLGHADEEARQAFATLVRERFHLPVAQLAYGEPIRISTFGQRTFVTPPAMTDPIVVSH